MSKGEGKIITIKFTEAITGSLVGNTAAFLVTGKEYQYVDGPENNGPLVDKIYSISSVVGHPTQAKAIQLLIDGPFNNSIGNLTVKYTAELGNLEGIGGAVLDFEETFTPSDLVNKPLKVGTHETLTSSISATFDLKPLIFSKTYETEKLTAEISGTINLYDLDDVPL